jgi:hypothetical protein
LPSWGTTIPADAPVLLKLLSLSIFLFLSSANETDDQRDKNKTEVIIEKDLSHPQFEIKIHRITFNGSCGSCAIGPRPNVCHVTMEVVDNTA